MKKLITDLYKSIKLFLNNGKKDEVLIPIPIDKIVHDNLMIPYRNKEKWGYVDDESNILIDFLYHGATPFSDSIAIVNYHDQYYFIDNKGNKLFDRSFDYAQPFTNGYSLFTTYKGPKISMNGRDGIIDTKGNVIIEAKFKVIHNSGFKHGYNVIKNESENWGYIKASGEEIYLDDYGELGLFSDGYAIVSSNFNTRIRIQGMKIPKGVIDSNFNLVIPVKYFSLSNFSEGLFAANMNDKWGFIDINDNTVVDFIYQNAKLFSNKLAAVQYDGQWGFIDRNNDVRIPFKYSAAYPFSEGLACVCQNNEWFYINVDGQRIIKFNVGSSYPFQNGIAKVYVDGYDGYIDQLGNKYWTN